MSTRDEKLAELEDVAVALEKIVEMWPRDDEGQLLPPVEGPQLPATLIDSLYTLIRVLTNFLSASEKPGIRQSQEATGHEDPEIDRVSTRLQELLRALPGVQKDLPPTPNVFQSGSASIPTNQAAWALLKAITSARSGKGWTDQDGGRTPTHKTPTNKGRGAVLVSMRDPEGTVSPEPDLLPVLWQKVRALDDLTSDTLLVCLAQWTSQGAKPNNPVWITADAILDARGMKRIQRGDEPGNWQHGHRREDRLEAGKALAQLENLWLEIVDVEVIPGGKRRKPQRLHLESRALAMLEKLVQRDLEGNPTFLAARVMPGGWAAAYWELGLRQTGLIAQRALAYDPYREQVEKRLAKYFAFQFRWDARRKAESIRLKVSTLIENTAIDVDQRNPQRTRERIKRALDRLQADHIVAKWGYVEDPDEHLPAKNWLPHWLEMTIWIEPPEEIKEHYASMLQPEKAPKLPEVGR
jgi:hypothetical protein